jgi:hypothetical protein
MEASEAKGAGGREHAAEAVAGICRAVHLLPFHWESFAALSTIPHSCRVKISELENSTTAEMSSSTPCMTLQTMIGAMPVGAGDLAMQAEGWDASYEQLLLYLHVLVTCRIDILTWLKRAAGVA